MMHPDSSASLPIESVLDDIRLQLHKNPTLLLIAEPGAGKTTRVPLALVQQDWLGDKMIVMLEPRRLAARNAAKYMASQLGENIGETVGYRIRLENRSSEKTRILVVTEGILTRMLQSDPELTGVGLVIFDEFHERHLHSDLALALSHQCQQVFRDDLKLLLMSATLDSNRLSKLLHAPVIQCPGRGHPVETFYRARKNLDESLTEHCARVTSEALKMHSTAHLLVFLPGVREIQELQRKLEQAQLLTSKGIHIVPLHGRLNDKEQQQALSPVGIHERKVILATNIAESSLTLEGVRIIIDSGIEKRLQFDPNTGISRLVSRRISQASSIQREGRAGRQASGWCYRLWPEAEQSRLNAHIEPEITQVDLSHFTLELLQWGAEVDELVWLTPPPVPALKQANSLLELLKVATHQGLTSIGKSCSQLGLEPRWASALLQIADRSAETGNGQQPNIVEAGCELVAMLQTGLSSINSDDIERQWLTRTQLTGLDKRKWEQQISPLAQRWNSILTRQSTLSQPPANSNTVFDPAWLIALAWPDRVAQLRSSKDGSRYQLSNGSGACLLPGSVLQGEEYLVVVDTSESRHGETLIRSAITLQEYHIEMLAKHIPALVCEHIHIQWQESGALLAESQRCVGQWIWKRKRLNNLSDTQWRQAWDDWFSSDKGLSSLHWDEKVTQLQARMVLVREHLQFDWPDVSTEGLIERRQDWLLPWLEGVRHQRELKKLNLFELLLNQLSWEQQQQLSHLAPKNWQVASGSCIQLDYNHNPPVLAVKLQELFGYEEQPTILNGKLPLMIHLLSPARRPVQITQDLPHFWRHNYGAVRKDLRGKYAKHPWPEDPLSAEATALTKRALHARQEQKKK